MWRLSKVVNSFNFRILQEKLRRTINQGSRMFTLPINYIRLSLLFPTHNLSCVGFEVLTAVVMNKSTWRSVGAQKCEKARLKMSTCLVQRTALIQFSVSFMEARKATQSMSLAFYHCQYHCEFKKQNPVQSASILCSDWVISKLVIVGRAGHFVTASLRLRLLSKGKHSSKQSQYSWPTLLTFYMHIILRAQTELTGVVPQDDMLNISSPHTSSALRATIFSSLSTRDSRISVPLHTDHLTKPN
jgi:hypothetical protein